MGQALGPFVLASLSEEQVEHACRREMWQQPLLSLHMRTIGQVLLPNTIFNPVGLPSEIVFPVQTPSRKAVGQGLLLNTLYPLDQ